MKQAVMLVDVALCHDCNNCFMACKDEHCFSPGPGRGVPQPKHGHRWIDILRVERGEFPLIDAAFLPRLCMQCVSAPCVQAGGGAVYVREDGIVIIDPAKAKGLKDLPASCPYEAIYYNDSEDLPQKCDFCAHLLDEGAAEPRCVSVCPTGALSFRRLGEEEIGALLQSGEYEPYRPEYGTHPRVLYKNLYRFTKHFLAGKLVCGADCAEDVAVALRKDGRTLEETVSNAFGEFRFDGLEPGEYELALGEGEGRACFPTEVSSSKTLFLTVEGDA